MKSGAEVGGCCFAMAVPWATIILVQAMGSVALARLFFLLADSDGGASLLGPLSSGAEGLVNFDSENR